jgi:hypothetical protein
VELAGSEKLPPSCRAACGSASDRARLAIDRADPLDEPTADLDPILTEQIGQLIKRIRPRAAHPDDRHPTTCRSPPRSPTGSPSPAGGRIAEAIPSAQLREASTIPDPRIPAGVVTADLKEAHMFTREQRIGMFFVMGLVLLLVAVELTLGLGILHKRYTVFATFPNVDGLNEGSDVRLGGLKAGRVESMKIDDRHVLVKMAVGRTWS